MAEILGHIQSASFQTRLLGFPHRRLVQHGFLLMEWRLTLATPVLWRRGKPASTRRWNFGCDGKGPKGRRAQRFEYGSCFRLLSSSNRSGRCDTAAQESIVGWGAK